MLLSNNLDDLAIDRAVGARTLAVRIGFRRARVLYAALMLAVLPAEILLWGAGVFDAWILLPLLTGGLLIARDSLTPHRWIQKWMYTLVSYIWVD